MQDKSFVLRKTCFYHPHLTGTKKEPFRESPQFFSGKDDYFKIYKYDMLNIQRADYNFVVSKENIFE